MKEFDYIIVGGGTAGCLLANRLSACGRYQILLLEAGPSDTSPLIRLPIGFGALFDHKRLNWRLQSEPEPQLNNRCISQPRGRVLGGSSAINGMMYVRGQPQDFDHWEALGNRGWSYQDVLPYFKRSEGNAGADERWHGRDGELAVATARFRPPLADAFIAASVQAGFRGNPDINGADQHGIDYTALYQRNGRRVSAARGLLHPVRSRKNLKVISQATARRILFKERSAVGIEVLVNGQIQEFRCRRELLLCAGSFHSPQLLQLSGVGAGQSLCDLDIPVVHDLPGVGQNLQEHLGVEVVHATLAGATLRDEFRPLRLAKHIFDYFVSGRGLLTFNGALVSGFTRLDGDAQTRPDCQMVFSPAATDKSAGYKRIRIVSGVTSMAYPLRPDARGSVALGSRVVTDPPVIRHNFLHSERDRQQIVQAVRLQRRVFSQPALAPYLGPESVPGSDSDTDENILDYVRNTAMGCYHPAGSCRMGQDDTAVVDEQLTVRGLKGIRVIDASIMPTLVSGNTNAAVTMIAEKGADMILAAARATTSRP